MCARAVTSAMMLAVLLLVAGGCGKGSSRDVEHVSEYVVEFDFGVPFVPFDSVEVYVDSRDQGYDRNRINLFGCRTGDLLEEGEFDRGQDSLLRAVLNGYRGPDTSSDGHFEGGIETFRCNVTTSDILTTNSFFVFAANAQNENGDNISPPQMLVGRVEQVSGPMVTTTSTSLGAEVARHEVTVGSTDYTGRLSALQFDLRSSILGGWSGTGSRAACIPQVAAELWACNDKGHGLASCAVVSIEGFDLPSPVMTCVYRTATRAETSDFSVTMIDASDPELGIVEDVGLAVLDVSTR